MRTSTLVLLIILSLATLANAQDQARVVSSAPKLSFVETSHNFGIIRSGQMVSHTFEFENTGEEPLVLTKVETTCGCTATQWTREPLQAGQKGQITVTFDSTGKTGNQLKVITVYSNALTPIERIKFSAVIESN
jgi:hypothetical protein